MVIREDGGLDRAGFERMDQREKAASLTVRFKRTGQDKCGPILIVLRSHGFQKICILKHAFLIFIFLNAALNNCMYL